MLAYKVGPTPLQRGKGARIFENWLKAGSRRFLLRKGGTYRNGGGGLTVQNKKFYSDINHGLSCMF